MSNNKKTANAEKQAKAVVVRTAEECSALYDELTNKVNREEWMQATKNGAYKLSVSKPEKLSDSHGTIKVGNTTYYLTSAGTTKTALLISFRSYLVYVLKRETVAAKLAAFPTFEEWCKKNAAKFAYAEELTGVPVSDDAKRKRYDDEKSKLGEILDEDEVEE